MNKLKLLKKTESMTSREIADLVELRHDNVKRSIEKLFNEEVISCPHFEDGIKSGNGIVEKVYVICKRDTYIIVAQLSPAFTARLVDRWEELESTIISPLFNIPTSLSSALRLAAEQAETIEAQLLQIEASKPAVEFVDKYVDATGLKGFRQVCKLLKVKENVFRDFMRTKGIMYVLGREWVPHAQHLDAGRFEIKAGNSEINGHAFNSARFTPKGIAWIAGELAKWNLELMGCQ
jgi:phage antirepressor YoqD-like protein